MNTEMWSEVQLHRVIRQAQSYTERQEVNTTKKKIVNHSENYCFMSLKTLLLNLKEQQELQAVDSDILSCHHMPATII